MSARITEPTGIDVAGPASGWACLLDAYSRLCGHLARLCMVLSVGGLICLVVAVAFQVYGRHILNSTPTWAESLSLLLVLFVTMLGAAAGVRDANHIAFESLVDLIPKNRRRALYIIIHLLVLLFGALMAWYCGVLAESVHKYKIPNLGLSEGWKYVPASLAGVLISIFSIEHIIALLRNKKVIPAWL